jgi:sulfide dehydrogenase cytochrome subunit
MPMKHTHKVGVLAASLVLGTMAFAAEPLSEAELQAAVLAGGCAGCHGTDGNLSGLSSRPQGALERRLLDFKYERAPSTVMSRIAKGFSDEELAEIARYFAQLDAR